MRVGTSLRDTGAPSPTALVMKASGPDLGDGPVPEALKVDVDRLRRPSSPPTGLKPIADELRSMLPFGSPKRGGQHEQSRRNTEETHVGRLIHPTAEPVPVPIDRGTGGISRRSGFGGTWMARHPGALAVVRRHCIGGSRRRVSDTSPTGVLDAAKAVKPAYPLSYNGAGEGLAPAPPSNPPLFALPRRSRKGAPPPSPVSARRDA